MPGFAPVVLFIESIGGKEKGVAHNHGGEIAVRAVDALAQIFDLDSVAAGGEFECRMAYFDLVERTGKIFGGRFGRLFRQKFFEMFDGRGIIALALFYLAQPVLQQREVPRVFFGSSNFGVGLFGFAVRVKKAGTFAIFPQNGMIVVFALEDGRIVLQRRAVILVFKGFIAGALV